jgi:hypothetical protein
VDNVCIRKCNVVILGAAGVGKTQLARTQCLNNLFFGQIDDNLKAGEELTELCAKYMIHIIDQQDVSLPT